ncbi:MAG: hypothetical protein V2B18_24260, partial [Pseudomonadota bacterium]
IWDLMVGHTTERSLADGCGLLMKSSPDDHATAQSVFQPPRRLRTSSSVVGSRIRWSEKG